MVHLLSITSSNFDDNNKVIQKAVILGQFSTRMGLLPNLKLSLFGYNETTVDEEQ